MSEGRFITVEGGEGTGKSTQVELLVRALRATDIDVLATREPGGTPGAENIRKLLTSGDVGRWEPMTETLLHLAARREHVSKTIRPALEAGRWVVSDRFADSTVAYQGYGHALGAELVARLSQLAIGNLVPDLTLILDLPVAAGLARAEARRGDEDRYERMDSAFHERLRAGYLEIARREPARCAVIDAASDIEAVQTAIRAVVAERLGV